MAVNKETAILEITAVDKTQAAVASASAGLEKVTRASQQAKSEADKAARQMRASFQQFGFQIQDIAVQAQMGTSPFVIFAQQGSQLASIFGAGGAVAGAFISIAGVIGMNLAPRIFDATSALEDLQTAGENVDKMFSSLDSGTLILSDSFLKMAEASSGAAVIELRRQRREIETAMADAREEMAAGIGGMLERIEREAAAAAIDPLTYATLVGVGQAPAIVGKGFEAIYGVTEESIAKLRELGKQASSGAIDDLQAFTSALSAIQEDPNTKAAFNEIAESISGLLVAVVNGEAQVAQLSAAMSDLDGFMESTRTESDKSEQSVLKMIEALQKQALTYDMSSTQIAVYEGILAGANTEQLTTIQQLAAELEGREAIAELQKTEEAAQKDFYKQQEDALKVLEKEGAAVLTGTEKIASEYDERIRIVTEALSELQLLETSHAQIIIDLNKQKSEAVAKALHDEDMARLESTQSQVSAMQGLASGIESMLAEGSAAQKAAFLVSQGLAFAEAIINAELASAKALAAFPTMPAYATAIKAMGYVSAGVIAGTTAASFEGGGFTGYGSRVGGLDGKGGMAAIVHPNETIIDHTKGGAGTQVNITIQANDTRGFDELLMKRRGVIASMVQSSLNNVGRKI
jgi:hypothetical protein